MFVLIMPASLDIRRRPQYARDRVRLMNRNRARFKQAQLKVVSPPKTILTRFHLLLARRSHPCGCIPVRHLWLTRPMYFNDDLL
jgi:hypothetical protein